MAASWLPDAIRLKLRTLFRGEQLDRELDEEIRYHLERKTESLIAQGLSPEDARFAALRAFDGVEQRKEDCRDARGRWATIWLERLAQDVRHGAGLLLKSPGFALIAILSVATGVGANAAMFSVADGLILRPLQIPDAGELIVVSATTPAGDVRGSGISYPDYADLRDRTRSFDGLAAGRAVVTGLARSPGELAQGRFGLAVSADFFDVLRVRPALGRAFVPDEDRVAGRDAVVVLAHETWMRELGGDPGIIGQPILLAGTPFTVVGITPDGFTGINLYQPPQFYVPLAMLPVVDTQAEPDVLARRDGRMLRVFGRLAAGTSLAQAGDDVALIARALQQEYPATNDRHGLLVRREMDARLDDYAPAAVLGAMLIGLALAVLLVACANVAGLLTSRAPARARETAVRLALGGSRTRLMRQMITESALIAILGAVIGLALAYGGIRFFQQFQYASDAGVRFTFALDRRAFVVGLAIAAVSALLSSLVPAWRSTRPRDLSSTLRDTATPAPRATRLWGRHGLVAVQLALTLVLLTVALSFYRAFEAEYGHGPGFRTDHLLLTTLDPALARYDQRRSDAFYQILKERLAALPGVTSVAQTTFVPLSPDGATAAAIVPEGIDLPPGTEHVTVDTARVDEGYFDTLGIPIVSGRPIRATDTLTTPRVAVVSRGMAARYWPGADPLGKRIRLAGPEEEWAEVVGVAADIKFRLFTARSTPVLYLPRPQHPSTGSTIVVRTASESIASAELVRAAILDIDRAVPILGMRTMEAFYDANAKNLNRVVVRTIAGMGTMGLLLALIGLYGLTAYIVSRRTREIGLRMAVGASPRAMVQMILRQGTLPSAAGVGAGVLASAAVGGLIRGVFPGTGADAVTFLLIVPVVAVVVMLAAYIPARRAARVDPLVALRQE